MANWNQAELKRHIDEQIEESQELEYKGAAKLCKQNNCKDDITVTVSSMSNAAGGTVIFGMAEYNEEDKKHLPEKIDPIDRMKFSREWLWQILNSSIYPRIEQIDIFPVEIDNDPTKVVYVVEVGQGFTAHQARDKKYHRRYGVETLAMYDHEIRDVMGRGQHPKIELEFKVIIENVPSIAGPSVRRTFHIGVANNGHAYAQYYNLFVQLPAEFCIFKTGSIIRRRFTFDGVKYVEIYQDNTTDVGTFYPLLPKRIENRYFDLGHGYRNFDDNRIVWSAFADNAPPQKGEILIKDIPEDDRR